MFFQSFDILWSQAGGGEVIGVLIFLFLVILQVIKAVFDARNAGIADKKKQEMPNGRTNQAGERVIVPVKSKRERKKPEKIDSDSRTAENEEPRRRRALSRELAPQGEGQRFEADPGTFDAARLVAPTVEPTVKPTLDSMTGIYEAAPNSAEQQDQPLSLDIQKLIARPEGIRQAIILAEILKRPTF